MFFDADIGRSFLHKKFVSAFGYLAAFSNASGSNLSDVDPPPAPVKVSGAVGEISIVETLPTTEPPKYISWSSTARLLSVVD